MPDKYRIAILLCDLEGHKGKDVARQLKIPEGTLASRLRTGRVMLAKFEIADQPNVTIVADPGPRGAGKIKRFLDLPLSWIPTTWVFKGGDLRYALNYGEVRFEVLQQFLTDANSDWDH